MPVDIGVETETGSNKKVAKSGNGQIEARDQCNFIVIALNYEGRMPPFINSLFT